MDPASQQAQQFYMQFITRYLHESGETRCRVTTITRMCVQAPNVDSALVPRLMCSICRVFTPPLACRMLRRVRVKVKPRRVSCYTLHAAMNVRSSSMLQKVAASNTISMSEESKPSAIPHRVGRSKAPSPPLGSWPAHAGRWTDGSNLQQLIAGFDQEAAAVLTARLATFKMETEDDFDATRWLDRTLIRLSSR